MMVCPEKMIDVLLVVVILFNSGDEKEAFCII